MARTKIENLKLKIKNWILWVVGGIILLISLTNFGLWVRNEVAEWKRQPIEQEIAKWEQIVTETPTYRDGYLKLATLYWKLQEDEKAKVALNKAIEIDSIYKETENLRKKLGY